MHLYLYHFKCIDTNAQLSMGVYLILKGDVKFGCVEGP